MEEDGHFTIVNNRQILRETNRTRKPEENNSSFKISTPYIHNNGTKYLEIDEISPS